jgi:ribosomal protein S12 methylthiotransferase accessory factor
LGSLGLLPSESRWANAGDGLASVTLRLIDVPGFSQGKGPTEAYSLASAYAEMLERLQTFFIELTDTVYGPEGTPPLGYTYPDQAPHSPEQFVREFGEIRDEIDRNLLDTERPFLDEVLNNRDWGAVPFYHVERDRVAYLPWGLRYFTASNGSCAGNTPAEALVQGFGEIFERFVLRELWRRGDFALPTVPASFLKTLPQWHYYEQLTRWGYTVSVKDCSLQGAFPVVGVLVQRHDRGKFAIGSAPDFGIALERCFTEMFQGRDRAMFDKSLRPILARPPANGHRDPGYWAQLHFSRAELLQSFLDESAKFEPSYLHRSRDQISQERAKAMLAIARRHGRGTFIRDVSLFGFPSFWIYVCGMSEVYPERIEGAIETARRRPKVQAVLRNLDQATPEELRELALALAWWLDTSRAGEARRAHHHLLGVPLKPEARFASTAMELLLAMIQVRLGDLGAAEAALMAFLAAEAQATGKADERAAQAPTRADEPLARCLLHLIRLQRQGHDLATAVRDAQASFPPVTLNTAVALLTPSTSLAKAFGVPRCRGCEGCEYRAQCYYEALKELHPTLQARIHAAQLDQTAVRQIFASTDRAQPSPSRVLGQGEFASV